MIMRPTVMARRGEADRMEAEFARIDIPLAGHIARRALLDGSDVLLAGNTAFVGVGARGNALGRNGFSQVAARARVPRRRGFACRPECPRLRSVAGAVAKDTIVLSRRTGRSCRLCRIQDDRGRDAAKTSRPASSARRTSRDCGHALSYVACAHAQSRRRGRVDRSVRISQDRDHAVDVGPRTETRLMRIAIAFRHSRQPARRWTHAWRTSKLRAGPMRSSRPAICVSTARNRRRCCSGSKRSARSAYAETPIAICPTRPAKRSSRLGGPA